jgi:hypothetical protein
MLILLDGGGWFPVQSVATLRELNYPMVVVAEVDADRAFGVSRFFSDKTPVYARQRPFHQSG